MTRFLIVNTDYPQFLDGLYANHPGLEQESYGRQLAIRNESLFGVSDFYPRNLHALGHEAIEVHYNNRRLQRAWAREHGLTLGRASRPRVVLRRGILPWIVRDESADLTDVLRAQIEEFRPDVILSHSLSDLRPSFWQDMRSHYRLLLGQIASPLADEVDLSPFDLMLSSLPNFVERFRRRGLRAELFRLAFDPTVLEQLGTCGPPIPVSFVGSLSSHHGGRKEWLEQLCRETPIQVWGPAIDELPRRWEGIHRAYQGPAWGLEMYRVLARSHGISVNFHLELSGPYANNLRLFESTGVGSLLLTDRKQNLAEMFEPGIEAVVYDGPDDCVERIDYYLDQETERAATARAGRQRTLREHTYRQRMAQLVELIGQL